MIAAGLLRGVCVPKGAIIGAYVVGAGIVAWNLNQLHDAYLSYRDTSDLISDLGAVDPHGSTATRSSSIKNIADTTLVRRHIVGEPRCCRQDGSPADSAAEIADRA